MIDEATKGKHCNDSCYDYYCSQNVNGRCQAPNKCLGVEEAAELMAELEAAKRKTSILIDTLAEVVASIEVRFPAIEYALDRKPYLDAKKILEQYKEEAALATTSSQNTQEGTDNG